MKYVRKSLATPGTQQIFRAQVMKYTSIESLGYKPSHAIKILSENPGKLFLWTFEPGKKYFFLQNLNFNCEQGEKFRHKSKTIY